MAASHPLHPNQAMDRLRNLILALITGSFLASCVTSPNDYSSFVDMPKSGWEYVDTVFFLPQAADSVYSGALSVAVRHNNNYPYSNLWLEVTHRTPGEVFRDTVDLNLANVYGRWEGRGFGPLYQLSDTIVHNRRFVKGNTIMVRHIMRVDTLPDVEQIGISIVSP